jgi:hypothetical protein
MKNLFRKGILSDPFCPFCLVNSESAFHALWSWPASVAVWQEGGHKLQKMVYVECDGLQLIKFLKEILDNEGFMEASIVMHLLWLHRNEYVFKGRFQPPSQVILSMKKTIAEYEEIPQEDSIGPEEMANIPLHWRAPRAGWFKANWDAALHSTLRKTGIG